MVVFSSLGVDVGRGGGGDDDDDDDDDDDGGGDGGGEVGFASSFLVTVKGLSFSGFLVFPNMGPPF